MLNTLYIDDANHTTTGALIHHLLSTQREIKYRKALST